MTDQRDPFREFLDAMIKAMGEETDRKMLELTKPAEDIFVEINGKKIPYLGEIKVIWAEEDEPMTEQVETFVRGYPKVDGKYFGGKIKECDCPACMARVEDERRMWAEIGIDVFGEEVRRDGE